jgi:hypothetical protein
MALAKGIPATGSLHRACSQFDEAQLACCESSADQALPRGLPATSSQRAGREIALRWSDLVV